MSMVLSLILIGLPAAVTSRPGHSNGLRTLTQNLRLSTYPSLCRSRISR